MKKFTFFILMITFVFSNYANSEDQNLKETEINVFTGMFDFSDDKQASGLFGFQHQNEELYNESFLGKLSPITGGFITEKSAFYFYTGAEANYDLGLFTFTPSFAPGYYNTGDGKDLGSPLEFKSEVQMSLNLSENSEFGMSYNHISNASLGNKNPGANSYMINFLKRF
ncbi:acyloxyacyl hydrolase [Pelagibacteraceae bacterium]|jgi:lipid A 3-O-deacylase|nr:acyloxyacyl hydrolase [Pelagibacteraceae bacterium]|tara:strand:+ start:234 stop:740 length:507 start_codon:yes stop_codon:yes gene_type:complete